MMLAIWFILFTASLFIGRFNVVFEKTLAFFSLSLYCFLLYVSFLYRNLAVANVLKVQEKSLIFLGLSVCDETKCVVVTTDRQAFCIKYCQQVCSKFMCYVYVCVCSTKKWNKAYLSDLLALANEISLVKVAVEPMDTKACLWRPSKSRSCCKRSCNI